LDVVARASLATALVLAGERISYFHRDDATTRDDPAIALSDDGLYVEFARHALARAADHVDAIHAGRVPYVPDRAFSLEDAQVLARAARVAALRDEPWFGPCIVRLLPGACVAPTAAKTAPSQALSMALGHAIELAPTPEGIEALRVALKRVRHGSIKKKLQQNIKPAERALAARPEMAIRLATAPSDRVDLRRAFATCLEAGFWHETDFSWREWSALLASGDTSAAVVRSLVWVARNADDSPTRSFMVGDTRASLSFLDERGREIAPPDGGRVSIWHPVGASDDERRKWQRYIAERRVVQPFRQAYREHYARPPEELESETSHVFEGHVLSLVAALGLAKREGWHIVRERALARRFGSFRVALAIDAKLFPGTTLGVERRRRPFRRVAAEAGVLERLRRCLPSYSPRRVAPSTCSSAPLASHWMMTRPRSRQQRLSAPTGLPSSADSRVTYSATWLIFAPSPFAMCSPRTSPQVASSSRVATCSSATTPSTSSRRASRDRAQRSK
jgi:hypothetical protein